ncbi:MAG TPA: hypothetical protein VEY31_02455, partial [Roseococcus sp.]|nr:hypothetical protein [Roseococcus sp.]
MARHLAGRIAAPDVQRRVPLPDAALGAPQHLDGASDALPGGAAGAVVFEVDGDGGAVVLADGGHRAGLAQRGQVVGPRLGGEEVAVLRLARGVDVEPALHVRLDQPLRAGMRLGQPEPVVVAEREGHVGLLQVMQRGDDVHHAEPLHRLGMVEGQAVGEAGAAVMARRLEDVVAEGSHQPERVAA